MRAEPTVHFLTDGGQSADVTLSRLIEFIDGANESLDIAMYDANLEPERADRLVCALDNAESRGVSVRAIYNVIAERSADEKTNSAKASPHSGPSLLERLTDSSPFKAINGVPDLMHHKYVVRDHDTVWTGSANWTDDSWTRQENVLITIASHNLAAAYTGDFQQLWNLGRVEKSGDFDDRPAELVYRGRPLSVRALFSPGRGQEISALIAQRIDQAQQRVVICSPVVTSNEILRAITDRIGTRQREALRELAVTVDGPQMQGALRQWRSNRQSSWKISLAQRMLTSEMVAQKPSTPYGPGTVHDFMHAKLVVCDDWVITGSFNCSHSGEMNAENVLEIHSEALADQCANFARQVHNRYAQR